MISELEEIRNIVSQVDGWLTTKEGELLYNLSKKCQNKGEVVEIGSWKGKSTIWMGKGLKAGKGKVLHAIDPHIGSKEQQEKYGKVWTFEEFKKNIRKAKINDVVIPYVKTSEEVAKKFDKPVELIFIDGAHDYPFVKKDFEMWFPKVINGGVMAFHDTIRMLGPRKVVEKFVFKSGKFKNIKFADSITYAEKAEKISFADRVRNQYILLLKEIYYISDKLKLPAPLRKFGKKAVKLLQT